MEEYKHEDKIKDAMVSIFAMIKKSGDAFDSNDSMKFSQAALNSANTLATFASMDDSEFKGRLDVIEDAVNQISSHLVLEMARQ